MSVYKLQRTVQRLKRGVQTRYHITLPREIIETVARWTPGFPLRVEWVLKGESFTPKRGCIVIYQPDSVWSDDT